MQLPPLFLALSLSVAATFAPVHAQVAMPQVEVVEYYHAGLDHYFITANAYEKSLLDVGTTPGWTRTGATFTAHATTDASGARPVCRFYAPDTAINSHFYAASPAECAEVLRRFSRTWIHESADVFAVPLPDVASGRCPPATSPVYRLFNDRADVNHRYTPDAAMRDSMIARGYRSEGYGEGGVAFCALGVNVATGVPPALRAPAWRTSLSRGRLVPIPGTANMNGVTLQGNGNVMRHRTIDAWNGLAAGETAWWAAANGGHDQGNGTLWENKVYTIDLAADEPRWQLAHPGSPWSMVTPNGDHYLDGLPVSRHTYYSAQFLESLGRVMLVGAAAPYAIGFPAPAFQGGPIMDGYDVATGRWDPAATWATAPGDTFWVAASIAKDPRTDDLYLAARHKFAKWTRSSNAWTRIVPRNADGSIVANPASWQYGSSLIDVRRNRWIHFGRTQVSSVHPATHVLTVHPAVAGAWSGGFDDYSTVVHDLDNDRYVTVQGTGLYAIDPETFVSTLLAEVPPAVNGVNNRLAYFHRLGGIAYLPRFSSTILFFSTR